MSTGILQTSFKAVEVTSTGPQETYLTMRWCNREASAVEITDSEGRVFVCDIMIFEQGKTTGAGIGQVRVFPIMDEGERKGVGIAVDDRHEGSVYVVDRRHVDYFFISVNKLQPTEAQSQRLFDEGLKGILE